MEWIRNNYNSVKRVFEKKQAKHYNRHNEYFKFTRIALACEKLIKIEFY